MANSLTRHIEQTTGWRRQIVAILGLLVWSVVALFAAGLVMLALFWLLNQSGVMNQVSSNTATIIEGTLFYVILFIILVGVPRVVFGWRTSAKLLGVDRSLKWADIGLALSGIVFYFVAAVFVMWLVGEFFPQIDQDQAQDVGVTMPFGYERYWVFFLFVILAPIMEELIFRGYMHGVLRKNGVSAVLTIIIVSVLFGAAHGQWNVAINVGVLSIVMGIAREATGTIWPGVVMHMIKNGIAFYALYVVL